MQRHPEPVPPAEDPEGSNYWLNAGNHDLILGNFSPVQEIASTNVVFKTTGCGIPAEL